MTQIVKNLKKRKLPTKLIKIKTMLKTILKIILKTIQMMKNLYMENGQTLFNYHQKMLKYKKMQKS
jgi:hypothetical protein